MVEEKIAKTPRELEEPDNLKVVDALVESLKTKRDNLNCHVSQIFDYKSNSTNFKYKEKTLLTNLVIEDIFKESCYLLQAVRYIVNNNYFE